MVNTRIQVMGRHYPERCHKIFLVNAPWSFSVVWSLIKPFLDPVTANKVGSTTALQRLSNGSLTAL